MLPNNPPPGAAIASHLISSKAFHAASRVGIYIHCAKLHEVDTMPVLQAAIANGETKTTMRASHAVFRVNNSRFGNNGVKGTPIRRKQSLSGATPALP